MDGCEGRTLSHWPIGHPVKVDVAQRAWMVHDVLHSRAMRAGSAAHVPSSDQSTQRESRSIVSPLASSHALHSPPHACSMYAGLREHSPPSA